VKEAINAYVEALEEDYLPVPEEHFNTSLLFADWCGIPSPIP